MNAVLYVLAFGHLIYAMLCARPIFHVVDLVNIYQSYPELEHWTVVRYIQVLKTD